MSAADRLNKLLVRAACGVVLATSASANAHAQPIPAFESSPIGRFALVIGVEKYSNHKTVDNAISDAAKVGAALEHAGFAVSYPPREPETADEMLSQIQLLVNRTGGEKQPATIVLYFAGHGFQLGGRNFLVPRLAPNPAGRNKESLANASLDIAEIIAELGISRRPGVTILMIDACRTNILEDETPLTAESPLLRIRNRESFRAGFTRLPDLRNAVLSLSTGYDDVARSASSDEPTNSPYALAVQSQILKRSTKLVDILADVHYLVKSDTGRNQPSGAWRQEPVSQNLERARNFLFVSELKDWTEEEEFLAKASTTNNLECLDYFVENYPDGRFSRHVVRHLDAQRSAASGTPWSRCPMVPR